MQKPEKESERKAVEGWKAALVGRAWPITTSTKSITSLFLKTLCFIGTEDTNTHKTHVHKSTKFASVVQT